LDLKSAFDTVDHRILFEKMKQLNIDGKLINSIEWLYRQTRFTVNGKEVPIGSGVIQGGVLSPALFIIMFNDLIS
jgi:retron-type reverse transcriptase